MYVDSLVFNAVCLQTFLNTTFPKDAHHSIYMNTITCVSLSSNLRQLHVQIHAVYGLSFRCTNVWWFQVKLPTEYHVSHCITVVITTDMGKFHGLPILSSHHLDPLHFPLFLLRFWRSERNPGLSPLPILFLHPKAQQLHVWTIFFTATSFRAKLGKEWPPVSFTNTFTTLFATQ